MSSAHRIAGLLAAATVLAVAGASVAQARQSPPRFVGLHKVAPQGKTVHVSVANAAGTFCTLSVRYADKAPQAVGRTIVIAGRATWNWDVPEVAKPGRATVTARCDRHGHVSRAVTVVGNVVPPRIVVDKQGFSVRPRYGASDASYGLLLRNLSPNADALDVYVLVNFVMADGHVLGTSSNTIAAIPAGTTYAYGGSLHFPGAAPIVQLEVVTKVDGGQRSLIKQPLVENVRVMPGRSDADWVGEVDGEVINGQPSLDLQRATLSTVVFDASGAIIGGGTGTAGSLLPPGTRQAFAISSGVDAIPWARAASAKVSPLGTYVP